MKGNSLTKLSLGPNGARAVLSDDEVYRYHLTRRWSSADRALGVIMLNPSTADAFKDDRTIKKITHYAKEWGYSSLSVANVFAYRSTSPADLKPLTDERRTGPENDYYITQVFIDAHDKILCGWGSNQLAALKIPSLWEMFCKFTESMPNPRQLVSIKTTNTGMPMHPLYQRNDLQPKTWRPS